jgi:hypothetical protein
MRKTPYPLLITEFEILSISNMGQWCILYALYNPPYSMGYFCPHEKNAKAVKNEMLLDIYQFQKGNPI